MNIIKYPSEERVNEGIRLDEPMLAAISDFLQEIGYLIEIKIPGRYSRHLKMITDESATL